MLDEDEEFARKQSEELNITEYEKKIKQVFGSGSLSNSYRITDKEGEDAFTLPQLGTPQQVNEL